MKPLETLLSAFISVHPEDAARAFETLSEADARRLFKSLPTGVAVALLVRLSPHVAGPLLEELESERIGALLEQMSPRIASAIVHQLEEEKRADVLARVSEEVARPLGELARYPAETAGAIMEPRVASLAIDLTAQQAISTIRKTARDVLHYLYVTDREGKLIGVLTMRDLLLASPREPIRPLVKRDVVTVNDTMDREDVVNLMRETGYVAIPVVDFDGRLVGVVKHGQAIEAGQLEAFEDFQKIVGAGADERALSPISTVVKSRLPWLYVNLLTAFLAASVIGLFEGFIAQMAALAVLLPVVAGQGGNTGSQSLAIVMRGLALREIIPGVKRRVVAKEVLAGLINGVAIAAVTALAVFAWRFAKDDPMPTSVGLALVIGLAMIVNMVVAALSGAAIPLILKAIGRDPAQSAAIFLTTVTDVVGFASFLGFAAALMTLMK